MAKERIIRGEKMKKPKIVNTEPPKRLRSKHHRCTQIKCGYYLEGSCQDCEKCSARPYEINESCEECYDCENVPGSLRWGEKQEGLEKECVGEEEEVLEGVKEVIEQRLRDLKSKPKKLEPEMIIQPK